MATLGQSRTVMATVLLFSTVLVVGVSFSPARWMLGILFLLFGLVTASLAVLKKHRRSYRQGSITRAVLVRNILLDMLGILLAMILAGLLGKYIAQAATAGIDHDLIRIVTGILLGVLVGGCIGLLIKLAWGRLIKA